jgi:transcriptional regulator
MYIPTQFRSDDLQHAVELMREHSFATLICDDDEGQPFVTYLPLHVDMVERDGKPWPVLLGHVARANPHWKYLRDRGIALVSYLGPHAYMSPRVYPDTMRVPTWNYLAVQCRVRVRLLTGRAELDQMLDKLIADNEPVYLEQWHSLGELEVTELECKLKLNQHRPESHAALRRALATGSQDELELLGWMDRLKL